MANIQYLNGDIFESKAQVIVNTVNCQGVMGKGLALAFKQKYPDMFNVYQQDCRARKLRIGRPTLYQKSTPWILNFPTKDTWRANSKIEYLEKGLEFLVTHYKKAGIKSIAFPKLGAQNGKLTWDDVGPLMAKYLSQLDIDVYIYIAEGDAEYQAANDPIEQLATANETKLKSLHPSVSLSHKDNSTIEETKEVTISQSRSKRKKSSTKKKDNNLPQFAQAALPGI